MKQQLISESENKLTEKKESADLIGISKWNESSRRHRCARSEDDRYEILESEKEVIGIEDIEIIK